MVAILIILTLGVGALIVFASGRNVERVVQDHVRPYRATKPPARRR